MELVYTHYNNLRISFYNYKAPIYGWFLHWFFVVELLETIHKKNSLTFDARHKNRFNGTIKEPRKGVRSGHIPKSNNIFWGKLVSSEGILVSKKKISYLFNKFQNNENILKIPEINIEVGQEYIEYLLKLKSVDNNLIYLTAAYNGGPGNLQKWQEKTNHLNDPLFFMESIPSRETRWFIEKVLTKYWIYQNKKGIESKSLRLLANGKEPIY